MKIISLFLAFSIAVIASGCGGMFKGKKAALNGFMNKDFLKSLQIWFIHLK